MATTDLIPITDGDGSSQLETVSRTINSEEVHAQAFVSGEPGVLTYVAPFVGISVATTNDHVIFIQGDATNYVRLNRIHIRQRANATNRSVCDLALVRTTTAGTGGGAISARPLDPGDTNPYAGTVQTLPTAEGTEGGVLMYLSFWLSQSGDVRASDHIEWVRSPYGKPPIAGPATADGFAIKVNVGVAAATVSGFIEFSLTPYL